MTNLRVRLACLLIASTLPSAACAMVQGAAGNQCIAGSSRSVFGNPESTGPDGWRIDSGPLDPQRYFGETVANGMIGLVSSPDPFATAGVMMQGVFDRSSENVDVILRAFNVAQMGLAIDGVDITHAKQVAQMRQTLDLRYGTLTSTFDYEDKASVCYTWYALRQLPYSALVDVTITPRRAIDIIATVHPDPPSGAGDVEYRDRRFQDKYTPPVALALVTAIAHSPSRRLLLAASHAFVFDNLAENSSVCRIIETNGAHAIMFTKHLDAGRTYHFATVGSTITSAQNANPGNEAERLTILAALVGPGESIARHNRAWEDLWRSDIVIEGDAETQRDVHAMLYHLYSFTREGGALALSPMGLRDCNKISKPHIEMLSISYPRNGGREYDKSSLSIDRRTSR